jgi:N-methylhydantoinase A
MVGGPVAEPVIGIDASLAIGLDMGGTFVDCVAIGPAGTVTSKAPTTAGDAVRGILAALQGCADASGVTLGTLLGRATTIVHGTTLGLNTLLEGSGGTVALLATRGHEDAVLIGRVHQKVAGLRQHEIIRAADLRKPDPLVPRWRIHGIDERVDARGDEVVRLDEAAVRDAATRAVADGCTAIAIAFLWSFLRPDHERRAAEIVRAAFPELAVVLSSDVAPVLGEYERTAATIVNAALLAPFAGYLGELESRLRGEGFTGRLFVMGMTGGILEASDAAARPVETLRSGPVGGIMAARSIGAAIGRPNVIATDMGGTSFDVGLLVDGAPHTTDLTVVGQLHVAVPAVDVRSIGAGGGSIAWLDEQGGLHVGPRSAGSVPGPACYGRGGTEPTVTDADLILGRLAPDAVLGGAIRLDPMAAREALEPLATLLNLDITAVAAGIVRIADAQMADLIRTATIERGHDPRDFTLVAFGGAGPLHVGQFAADVGVREVIVPATASVLSAAGLASADYRRTYRRSRRIRLPLEPSAVLPLLAVMTAQASAEFAASGLGGVLALSPWVDVRYRRQTHQLRVPLRDLPGEDVDLASLTGDFEERYAQRFGSGTGYAAAGMEATSVGVDALATRARPLGVDRADPPVTSGAPTPIGTRRVWFDGWADETPVFRAASMPPGSSIDGPAIVEFPATSLVVYPGQSATTDEYGSAWLRIRSGAAS